jgi:hypothetical protein
MDSSGKSVVQSTAAEAVISDPRAGREASALNWMINILVLSLLVLALMFLVLWLIPHSKVKAILDSAAAVPGGDGRVIHPTEGGLNAAVARLPFAFGVLGISGLLLAILKDRLKSFLLVLPSEVGRIREAFRTALPRGIETRWEVTTLLVVLAIGIFLRVWNLGRSIRYDEATTYLNYASYPIYRGLSNYSYPNNHLFNTLLAHLSMAVFGHTTVALRLPALIAGCLVIPASWLTCRILYNRTAAILTAGCVAAMPTFIEYSINARGYVLQWFFILVMISCSAILCRDASLRTAWLGFVLAAVGGFWCVPTMLVPTSAIVLWMLVDAVANRDIRSRRDLPRKLPWAVLAMALLSAVLYLPPILGSGTAAIFANPFVTSRATSFLDGLLPVAQAMWVRWFDGVPAAVIWALVGGTAMGLLWNRKVSTQFVPLTLILFFWSLTFAWLRNVVGYPRVWNYLLLAAVMTATAGWSLILNLIGKHFRSMQIATAGVASLFLTIIIGTSLIRHNTLFLSNETTSLTDIHEVVNFLRTELRPGTALVVAHPAGPIISYELLRADKKLFTSLPDLAKAERVIVVLTKFETREEGHPLNEHLALLAAEGPVAPSQAAYVIDLSAYGQPSLIAKFLSVTIYSFPRKRI